MKKYFTALRGAAAYERFAEINKNPGNGYLSGYEHHMDNIPMVNDCDSPEVKEAKLLDMQDKMIALANEIKNKAWVRRGWPQPGNMLTRTMLAIDGDTGAQIVLVRWNIIETPIHGHQYGQMLDMLLHGSAEELEYDIIDPVQRTVVANGSYQIASGPKVLSYGYYQKSDAFKGALVHKFITKTQAVTLHFIPELPPDGKGNLFTEINPTRHETA